MKQIKWLLIIGVLLTLISGCGGCVNTDVDVGPSGTKKTGELNITLSLTPVVLADKLYVA